ncbi:MAG: hypothetical protein A2033_06425 [Bacteroidetes bacterium GWA2_31_9]|nr:MAG: hypothetical protein A2033_06425 [Bacteroidetes bacterium GWA2_31_9]
MKSIRKLLVKLFGINTYLKIVSKIYIFLVKNGCLKKKYPEIFNLKNIVKQDFVCIDIGANLGYYSYFMSKYAGKNGKLYSVEPIPMFANIWKSNMKSSDTNYKLFQVALGGENKTVQMGIPERDGVLRHGLTKITSSAEEKYVSFFDVEMKIPDELFADLTKIDFIKCDVEGYESIVFDNFKKLISKHRPLVQTELSGIENRLHVIELFKEMNYSVNVLEDEKLIPISENDIKLVDKDFYFIPQN